MVAHVATLHIVSDVVRVVVVCGSQIVVLAALTCGSQRLPVVRLLAEEVCVASHVLVAEVEHQCRVESHSAETGLEVQVRTGASSGVAAQSDRVSGTYLLVFCHEMLRHVSVDGLQTVVVAYHNVVAVSVCLISHDAHLSVECRTDGVADIYLDVETLVHASPTASEVGSDDSAGCRHAEVFQVYAERVWKFCGAVSVSVVPVFV